MIESHNSSDLISTTSDAQSFLSVSTHPDIKYRLMPNPLSVYVPLNSLTKETIDSVVAVVQQSEKKDWHFSKRTTLAFLLAIHNKVSEIEKSNDSNNKFDESTIQLAAKVRQWLEQKDQSGQTRDIQWDKLRENYEKLANENENEMAKHYDVKTVEPYYELTINGLHPDINQSREYMARFRSHGWEPNELKVYWNATQVENLCPKHETNEQQDTNKSDADNDLVNAFKNQQINVESKAHELKTKESNDTKNNENETADIKTESEANELKTKESVEQKEEKSNDAKNNQNETDEIKTKQDVTESEVKNEKTIGNSLPVHDPCDTDAVDALQQYPVSKRNHAGKITYVHKGIEKAVFDPPEDAQLIVLNFANERSPGGGYLRHAWAQEEIILFNSDGYRSLLDLKYGRMGGGYAIPEFGVAYVRDIRFFDKHTGKHRKADMLVSACYCLSGSPQLYDNPTTTEEWITKNVAKFRAFIAAAVANTVGDGSNTYLLLGPIGTGAFGNDVTEIGYVFRDVLSSTMMGSNGPIRKAFEHIWFVSTDKWKNDRFATILNEDDMSKVE